MYASSWDAVPEIEVLPGNFRTAMAGAEMGLNRIRWVHPTVLPRHTHADAEQAMIVIQGRLEMTIAGQACLLGVGDLAVIPRGSEHSGRSIEGEAVFIEVFAPVRIQNLVGFLGEASLPPPEADR